ncbi:MAG: HAD family hydrolase [Gaiellaceae bacterium]
MLATTLRAVIFDFWGTLVPFDVELWRRRAPLVAEALGVGHDEFMAAWTRTNDERSTSDLRTNLEGVCRELGLTPSEKALQEALRLRRELHRSMFVPRDDAVPTLGELRGRGYATGLVTNCTSEIPELFAESALAGLMDAEVFSCTAGVKKPDPRIYALATAALGVPAEECLYVGDGGDGELEGARSVGMSPVLLNPGDTFPPPGWKGPEIARLGEVTALLA